MSREAIWSKGPFSLYRRELKIVGKTEATTSQIKTAAREILEQRDAGAWGIGDLCVYAEGIGKEEPVDTIAEELVRDRQMVRKCYYVAKAIAPEQRKYDLWWSFYFAVYTFPEEVRDKLLSLAEKEKWNLDEFKKHLRDIRRTARVEQQDFPEGTYGLIYADPPWQYENGTTDPSRVIENQYPTMALDEIRDLSDPRGRGVADLCAPACILYMWTTNVMLEAALSVGAAWGFEYKTNHAWVKDLQGMGVWVRGRHELLLIFTKGEVVPPAEGVRPDSVIQEPVGEHSKKPEVVYDMLETMYPGIPRIELFAREARDGWDRWGDQAPVMSNEELAADAGSDVDPDTGDVAEAGEEQEQRERAEGKKRKKEPKSRVSESASGKKGGAKKTAAKPGPRLVKDPKKERSASKEAVH